MPSHYENLDNGGGMPPEQRGRNIIAGGLGGAGMTLERIKEHGQSVVPKEKKKKKYKGPPVSIGMSADLRAQMRADESASVKRSQARTGTEGQIIAAGMGPGSEPPKKRKRSRRPPSRSANPNTPRF